MNFNQSCFRVKLRRLSKRLRDDLASAYKLSSEQIDANNFQRRQALVKHCQINVPFYQNCFRQLGINWQDIKTESDFAKLPILEKPEVRQFQSELISNTAYRKKKLRPSTTGGTTGEPLTIFQDPNIALSVMTCRMLNMWGVDISDNSAYLYRAIPRGWRKRAMDVALYPTRRAYIAAAEMGLEQMQRFTDKLLKIKPKYLVGYVGAIDAYADYLNQVGIRIPSLKVIWTTAAPLPDLKRQYFQETFQCPIYTQYGSVEVFMIGAECPRQCGLHVYNDIRHVEIVDAEGRPVPDGEWGDILVTDLTNYAFPLLRYRLGDRGRFLTKTCDCGLPFPLMDYVKGRISDQIYLKDGSSVPGEYWTTIFDDHPEVIKSFQIYQHSDYSIEIRYEPKSTDPRGAIEAVSADLKSKLGQRADFYFTACQIDNNENGKTRFVKSEIKR